LSCLDIGGNTSLEDIIVKINTLLCDGVDVNILTRNGISQTDSYVELGGNLTKDTTINTTIYDFIISGELFKLPMYPSSRDDFDEDTVNFLFTLPDGNIQSGSLSELQETFFSSVLTFNNGLTRTSNTITLGGNLIEPTVIDAATEGDLVTNTLWIKNNTAIGGFNNTDVAVLQVVHSANATRFDVNPLYVNKVYIDDSPTVDSYAILGFQSMATDATNTLDLTGVYNASISGIISQPSNANIDGNINCFAARLGVNAAIDGEGGDIESVTLYRAVSSVDAYIPENYGGTIPNIYGFYCEDLSTIVNNDDTATITNSWGIYQAGASDVNYFNGNTGFGTTTPSVPVEIYGVVNTSTFTGLRVVNNAPSSGNAKIEIVGGNAMNRTVSINDQGITANHGALFIGSTDRVLIDNRLGVGVSSFQTTAALQVDSTTQGFLPPRMTATQGSAIASPAEGLLIYVTNTNGTFTSKGFWGYTGAAWEKLNN
jgi:hypothetical protein